MKRFLTVLAGVLLTAAAASARAHTRAASADQAAHALHALVARNWQREMREDPLSASANGVHTYDGAWPDLSLASIAHQHDEDVQTLKDLAAVDRGALPPGDRLTWDLFKYRYAMRVEGYRFRGYLMPLNQLGGIQTTGMLARSLRFENVADYANWVKRLETFGPYMDQTIALLREGVATGITPPRIVMQRVSHQIAANIVARPEDSAFYAPFKAMPATIPADEQARLRAAARAAIAGAVVPAYRKFQKYFDGDYLPHCRTSIAAGALPDGKAWYEYDVRQNTTTDMTPEQIHALGLKKVAEIRAQMAAIFRQVGYKGDYAGFLHYLRTDPRFYYKDPQDLLEAYRAAAKRVDPHLAQFFPVGLLPRVPYGVHPIPAALAPDTYPAYSEPPAGDGSVAGYMAVNLYKPESRPKYDIQVLTCHEARPGHQLQIPVAMELENLPDFRRFDYYSAHGEGWALYSETLCDEMGLYDNPYSRFGYLDYQMWRAVRLVVDTGIHAQGWTRAQAVGYFEDNTALSEQNINTEVDRYIAWPGQALSYMIGEIEIRDLRREAEHRLGPKFDLKGFHAAVLAHGSVPLTVLRQVVEEWIGARAAGKPE